MTKGRANDKRAKRHKTTKVKLPRDRTGCPIEVGDVIEFEDGERVKVDSLTYFGDSFDALGYRWIANYNEEFESDNLEYSTVVWRKPR